jgi:hypothetical protein
LVGSIETLQKVRDEHATEKSEQDKQMEEIMMKVKGMIEESTQAERLIAEKRLKEEQAKADEKLAGELAKGDKKLVGELAKADKKLAGELAKADEKLACELAKADEKLAGELAKANNRIDELESELHSSNDRADEIFYKLQEVDAVTMDTLEWISLGVCPEFNRHLHKLIRTVTGHSLTGSNQTAKPAQHRAGKTCFIHPTYRHTHRRFTHLARSTGIHRRFPY